MLHGYPGKETTLAIGECRLGVEEGEPNLLVVVKSDS